MTTIVTYIRHDIYLLQLGLHPVAVVLTLYKKQEQKYTQGETIQITEHTKLKSRHKTMKNSTQINVVHGSGNGMIH